MRAKAVVGNWKLNGSLGENAQLLQALRRAVTEGGAACAVCVPFPYLAQARGLLEGSPIGWGSQDVSRHAKGAFTGEVSASNCIPLLLPCAHRRAGRRRRVKPWTLDCSARPRIGSLVLPVLGRYATVYGRWRSLAVHRVPIVACRNWRGLKSR